MKPMERTHPGKAMPDSLRRHHFGPIQPMARPSLFDRLRQWWRR